MKYSELISFQPIEDVIQLTASDDAGKAREYVRTYVMSDAVAESLRAPVIGQLHQGRLRCPGHFLRRTGFWDRQGQ